MADEEHVALLRQGVKAWNKWRRDNPKVIPNLERAYLEAAQLQEANLSRANLSKAKLRWATLTNANLRLANFANADLLGTNLRGANLDGAILINVQYANLQHARQADPALFQKFEDFLSQLVNKKELDNEIIIQIAKLLKNASEQERLWLIEELPNCFRKHETIFPLLKPEIRIDILAASLSKNTNVENEATLYQISETLESLSREQQASVTAQLNSSIKKHNLVFRFLTSEEKIEILSSQLSGNQSSNKFTILEIAKIIDRSLPEQRQLFLNQLQPWVKEHQYIFPLLNSSDQISILASRLQQRPKSEHETIILEISKVLEISLPLQRPSLTANLKLWLKAHNLIFPFLEIEEQIAIVYSQLENGSGNLWQKLSPNGKILCIYRAAKESTKLSQIIIALETLYKSSIEKNSLVRCVLKLLWAKQNPEQGNQVFQQVNSLLCDYIIEQAKLSNPLELDPLLPECKPQKVKYCEGRPWRTEEDKQAGIYIASRAWCPRANCSCSPFDSQEDESRIDTVLEGARLYPDCRQHWKNWSLLELLEATSVVPKLPGLSNPNEYVQKLSGWVNRINEIRERLKCSVCKEIMPHNIKYAKFTAKFRTTVFSCKHGLNHDQNIYLNECWGCGEIIDNRESKYKNDKYYICIHCGSGSQHSKEFMQGDICPKCGQPEMTSNQSNSRYRHCRFCDHSIRLPERWKITGSHGFDRHSQF